MDSQEKRHWRNWKRSTGRGNIYTETCIAGYTRKIRYFEDYFAEGEYGYVHDWEKEITGSAILDRGSFRGRPDIQERVRVWRDVFEQLLKEYSGDSLRDKERAYVDRGRIRGSVTEANERDIGTDAERETGEVKPQYPFRVEPDGSVRLFHWSSTTTD
jgi:hypothetical protein